MSKSLVRLEIAELIHMIRGKRLMLDADLAELYAVETGQLNRAVKRNSERFPDDFMFQLSDQEFTDLKCQSGISSSRLFPHQHRESETERTSASYNVFMT